MPNRENRPKPKNLLASKLASMPPILASNMSAVDYVTALKESKWDCDYGVEVYKSFLQVDSIADVVYSTHKAMEAAALVIRYTLPDFVKSVGFNIDRVVGLEADGEYAPTFSNIEIAPGKTESRLIYGNYFISDDTHRYIIHLEEGYQNDFKFTIASRKDAAPDSHIIMEQMLDYAKKHNFLRGKKIDPHCRFIKFDRTYTWDDLIIPEKIKNDIRTNLQNLIEFSDIYKKNGLQLKRGLVLSGQPGTGKTQLVKVLCNQIDWSVVWVSPKHLEGGAKKIAHIVELCKELSPTVMVLEDIDLYGGSRDTNHNPALLGEMMNQLDGVQENTDIITIATTNNKEVLEKALVSRPGRFDVTIEFTSPEYAERLQMLKIFSNGLITDSLPFIEDIAKEYSKGLTGAQVRELVNMTVIVAVDEKSYDADKKLILKEEHFKKAAKSVKGKDFSKVTGFSLGTSSPINIGDDLVDLDDL